MQRARKLRVSWWLALLQALLVRYIKVDEAWIERVRQAAAEGPLVFVLRNRNLFDFICLRGLCAKHDLPRISFVAGLWPFIYRPWWLWLFLLVRGRSHERRVVRMRESLASGGAAVVFLRRPAVGGALGSQPVVVDGIRLAIDAQRDLEAPVIALPTVFLWGEHAMKRLPGAMDFLFGSNEYPRLLRSLWLVLRRRAVHDFKLGEPLNLAAIKEQRGVSEDQLAGIVRAGVGRRIEKIRRARLGTLTKPSARVKTEVIGSPRLREELEAIAEDENIPSREITGRVTAIVAKLAADIQPRVVGFFAFVMAFVWKRIYTGIEVIPEDMDEMRRVVSRGPTLVLPTHKSHIDYMVISQVMQTHNMMLPHIAAGQNLSFWPLGWLFRSSGAFFIRRRFVNDRFYSAVVNTYLRHLVKAGYAIEVFIEGTRSRTGKLLRPKTGMLEMTLSAHGMTPGVDLQVLPTFIGYERVIEEGSYVSESLGSNKKSENIKGLIKSTRVLLSRYGKLYVRVGSSFTVDQVLADLGHTRKELQDGSVRREIALEVAMRNYREINRIAVVTASAVLASALLTHMEETIRHTELRSRVLWLIDLLGRTDAPLSDMVRRWVEEAAEEHSGKDLLDRTIRLLVRGGRIDIEEKGDDPVYRIREGQRQRLDYYKNNIIHFLVPSSLVCGTCLGAGEEGAAAAQLCEDVALAARLYRWEFPLPGGTIHDEERLGRESTALVEETVGRLVEAGVLERRESGEIVTCDRERAEVLAEVLRNYHEIYLSVVSAVRERVLDGAKVDTGNRAIEVAVEQLASGRFRRPEGHSRINLNNAIQSCKELKILRPASGEEPYAEGGLGDRIFRYLERSVGS